MTKRFLILATLALLGLGHALHAQDDDESKFNQKQAEKLDEFAKKAFEKGFPRQAKLIWLQAIKLYDENDEEAHKALGHIKVGSSWNPNPAFHYPTDDTGSERDASYLFKAYEKLKDELASAHRRQAEMWEKAGRKDKSDYHWKMVLRWVKDDKKAEKALNHVEVGSLTGTELEQTLYERSKMIEKAVAEQSHTDYPVEVLPDSKQPLLDKAQVKYQTVKSEHFTLRGDAVLDELKEAAKWAERALRVMQVAFPEGEFNGDPSKWLTDWAFFTSKDTWKQVLNANASLIPNLQWTLENASTSVIASPDGDAVMVGALGDPHVLFDSAVRNVAQSYSGFRTDGLREGIGHTFVGMMFNNNRLFSIDLQKQQGTVASEEDRAYTSPDFDVWKDLNLELAWKSTGGVPAVDIPFCDAANFTNEQRIKAWSFCDYVMRRDPTLLKDMDRLGYQLGHGSGVAGQTGGGGIRKRPLDLEKEFTELRGVSIAQLDKEWEDFWTGASPVLQAITSNTPPLESVSHNVQKWLAAFNEARKGQSATPVTWSANYSSRCRDHALYLKENKKERGPGPEHREDTDLGGTRVGNLFAQMAVVSTDAKLSSADKLFESWLDIPGYRDVLVHDFLLTIGLYTEGDILVMNVTSGLGKATSRHAGYLCYPRDHARGISTEVEVERLGPELVTALEEHGKEGLKVVGYPLTLHFGTGLPGNRNSYRCSASGREGAIDGVLMLDAGTVRTTTAPGMATFIPFEPLPHGQIDVVWAWETDRGPQRLQASFLTK